MTNRCCLLLLLFALFAQQISAKSDSAGEEIAHPLLPDSEGEMLGETEVHAQAQALLEEARENTLALEVDDAYLALETIDQLLEKFPNESLECEANMSRSIVYLHRNQLFLALELAEKARLVAVKLDRKDLLMPINSTMGAVFVRLRKYDEGIVKLQQSYEYAQSVGDQRTLISSINSLAVCYWRLKDWESSERYLRLALDELSKDNSAYYVIKSNIAVVLIEQQKFEEAEAILTEVYAYYQQQGTTYPFGLLWGNMADLEIRKGNFDQAMEFVRKSIDSGETNQNQYVLTRSYRHLGQIYIGKGMPEAAKDALNLSLKHALDLKDPAEEIETKNDFFEFYKSQGNFEEALKIQNERYSREEEILSNYVKTQSVLFNVRFETEQKQREIELLKTENKLVETKARAQELEIQKAADELKAVEQQREFQAKLRNLILLVLLGFSLVMVMLVFMIIIERKLRRDLQGRKQLLADSHGRLVESNKKLELLNQEKDEILGIVAHDLRNPLSAQMGLGELLAEGNATMDASEITEYANDIVDSSCRMEEIISLLLVINQLEQGAIEAKTETVELQGLLNKIIANNRILLEKKHQQLETEFDESLLSIETDPKLLMQVIDNLLSNAVKYSPFHKEIRVIVRAEKENVLISIKDEGPGISEEDQELLFKKFKKGSNRPTAGESSVGLGLSIVDHLVKLLNGKIWVESQVGQGSEFFVSFPFGSER